MYICLRFDEMYTSFARPEFLRVMFPALIEFVFEFITYLDFEIETLMKENYELICGVIVNEFKRKVNPAGEYFRTLVKTIPVTEQFNVTVNLGQFYCLQTKLFTEEI